MIVILFSALYESTLSSNPKVVILNPKKADNMLLKPVSVYQAAASKLISASISNQNKLSINTSKLDSELQQQFPELVSVSFNVPLLGRQLDLDIVVAKPELILNTSASGKFIIDDAGKAVASDIGPAAQKLSGITLPVVTYQSITTVKPGDTVLASSDVSFINMVEYQLSAHHISVQSMQVPSGSRELDVYISGVPYFVKFNLNDSNSTGQQIGTYLATAQYLAGNHITPSTYIDSRIPGRVYYK
jgi:hypothetical protein